MFILFGTLRINIMFNTLKLLKNSHGRASQEYQGFNFKQILGGYFNQ